MQFATREEHVQAFFDQKTDCIVAFERSDLNCILEQLEQLGMPCKTVKVCKMVGTQRTCCHCFPMLCCETNHLPKKVTSMHLSCCCDKDGLKCNCCSSVGWYPGLVSKLWFVGDSDNCWEDKCTQYALFHRWTVRTRASTPKQTFMTEDSLEETDSDYAPDSDSDDASDDE